MRLALVLLFIFSGKSGSANCDFTGLYVDWRGHDVLITRDFNQGTYFLSRFTNQNLTQLTESVHENVTKAQKEEWLHFSWFEPAYRKRTFFVCDREGAMLVFSDRSFAYLYKNATGIYQLGTDKYHLIFKTPGSPSTDKIEEFQMMKSVGPKKKNKVPTRSGRFGELKWALKAPSFLGNFFYTLKNSHPEDPDRLVQVDISEESGVISLKFRGDDNTSSEEIWHNTLENLPNDGDRSIFFRMPGKDNLIFRVSLHDRTTFLHYFVLDADGVWTYSSLADIGSSRPNWPFQFWPKTKPLPSETDIIKAPLKARKSRKWNDSMSVLKSVLKKTKCHEEIPQ